MKVLYISAMSSPDVITKIHNKNGRNPGFAMQKFNRLIAEGLVKNDCVVETLSAVPARRKELPLLWCSKSECYKGVLYHYIPLINLPIIRQISLFVFSFVYVLFWSLTNRKNKRLIFDVLNISVCIGGLLASKLTRIKTCGIMTDMPGLMVGQQQPSLITKITSAINKFYLSSFNCYVFLTEAMNDVINKKKNPYIVMEGLVDSDTNISGYVARDSIRHIIYAGGLFDEYGISTLVMAFMKLPQADISLDLFGEGPIVPWIQEQTKVDNRICYHGVKSNAEVMDFETKSFLLVNPRPTHAEFTKYSFPSKNMEYMTSGVALLTTRLPGMPKEYNEYVYLFDDEDVAGYHKSLNDILEISSKLIEEKGRTAREFILSKKNNIIQSQRILEMIYAKRN